MRLDLYLFKSGLFDSRTKSLQAIERGEILIDGKVIDKPSYTIDENFDTDRIKWEREKEFVSLGGYKLDKALSCFNFSVANKVCVDLGASTGGFTHCLLKEGAKKVYAVDLNDSLLHKSLKEDSRVIQVVNNAKNLNEDSFADKIEFISADLSFISETLIIPVIKRLLIKNGYAILLIKPQFESDTKKKFKNGIVNDKLFRKNATIKVLDCAKKYCLIPVNFTTAPIRENKNIEYLVLLYNGEGKEFSLDNFDF